MGIAIRGPGGIQPCSVEAWGDAGPTGFPESLQFPPACRGLADCKAKFNHRRYFEHTFSIFSIPPLKGTHSSSLQSSSSDHHARLSQSFPPSLKIVDRQFAHTDHCRTPPSFDLPPPSPPGIFAMASRKPDLRLSMPERDQASADSQHPQNTKISPRSPRSPRFREDFDAPFSEALMNASSTALTTDVSGSFPSTQNRNSVYGGSRRHNTSHTTFTTDLSGSFPSTQSRNSIDGGGKHYTYAGTAPKTQVEPEPFQARHDSWTPTSESTRQSSVNDRIREWAKKSFPFSRKGSVQSEDGTFSHQPGRRLSKPVINPPSDNTNPDTCASPDKYRQSVIAVTEVKGPR